MTENGYYIYFRSVNAFRVREGLKSPPFPTAKRERPPAKDMRKKRVKRNWVSVFNKECCPTFV